MKYTKYQHYTAKETRVHVITGSNCNTLHTVPEYLDERLAHALMGFVHGKLQLTDTIEHVRSKHHTDNLKLAFQLQALGIVYVDGIKVCLRAEYLSLVKRLKADGWYYWYGIPNDSIEQHLRNAGRLIEAKTE